MPQELCHSSESGFRERRVWEHESDLQVRYFIIDLILVHLPPTDGRFIHYR